MSANEKSAHESAHAASAGFDRMLSGQVQGCEILIAGAGIGGLAAALALQRQGWQVRVIEQASEFSQVGAGIQLGPNAMRALRSLGLEETIACLGSLPQSIQITDAGSGQVLSRIQLGSAALKKYAAPYICTHRADLHGALLSAAKAQGVLMETNQSLLNYELFPQFLRAKTPDLNLETQLLIGADGLWSPVRQQLLGEAAIHSTGHSAFRSLLATSDVPPALQDEQIHVWWAPRTHVVFYALRPAASSERLFNLVVLTEDQTPPLSQSSPQSSPEQSWSLEASASQVLSHFSAAPAALKKLLQAAAAGPGFQRWDLFERPALAASQMAQGRIALLGDAAHPMLPYLAQGAAMALEDACSLAKHLPYGLAPTDWPAALQAYAQERAARNARVMRQARRNGQIFHLSGLPAWARNAALRLRGEQVLGMQWLYGYEPKQAAST